VAPASRGGCIESSQRLAWGRRPCGPLGVPKATIAVCDLVRPKSVVFDALRASSSPLGHGPPARPRGSGLGVTPRVCALSPQFELAEPVGRRRAGSPPQDPPLSRRQLQRLSPALREAHLRWREDQLHAPAGGEPRRRCRLLALSLIELGERLESTESDLLRWIPPGGGSRGGQLGVGPPLPLRGARPRRRTPEDRGWRDAPRAGAALPSAVDAVGTGRGSPLPPGWAVTLASRGTTFVREVPARRVQPRSSCWRGGQQRRRSTGTPASSRSAGTSR
jgi:hypothetical protein